MRLQSTGFVGVRERVTGTAVQSRRPWVISPFGPGFHGVLYIRLVCPFWWKRNLEPRFGRGGAAPCRFLSCQTLIYDRHVYTFWKVLGEGRGRKSTNNDGAGGWKGTPSTTCCGRQTSKHTRVATRTGHAEVGCCLTWRSKSSRACCDSYWTWRGGVLLDLEEQIIPPRAYRLTDSRRQRIVGWQAIEK